MSNHKHGEKVLLEVMFKETLGLSGKATIEPIIGPMPSGVTVEVDLKHVRQWTPPEPAVVWTKGDVRIRHSKDRVWVESNVGAQGAASWVRIDDAVVIAATFTAYEESKLP